MTIQEFITVTNKDSTKDGFTFRPRIICNDGFSLSIQAGKTLYSDPRELADSYAAMEISYPSEIEDLILHKAEEEERPTDTVYPYVPAEIIEQVIEKHGGIDVTKTFKPNK